MSEELYIPKGVSREEVYKSLYPQLKALTASEPDLIANMANITSALNESFGFFGLDFTELLESDWC